MTLQISEDHSAWLAAYSPFTNLSQAMPPRDPNDDDDEDGNEEDNDQEEQEERPVIREPDEE
jgi:hypothetical protein